MTTSNCSYCPKYVPPKTVSRGSLEYCKSCGCALSQVQRDKLREKRAWVREVNEGRGMVTGEATSKSWSKGRRIPALPSSHPDHFVESQKDMERVMQRHNISMETGDFADDASRHKAAADSAAAHHRAKRKKKK